MLNVLHLSDSLAFGGLERLVFNFATKLDPRKYQVSACCLHQDGVFGEKIRQNGKHVHVIGKKPGLQPGLLLTLYNLFRHNSIDILHTHNFSPLLYGVLPARLAGVKVIVHTDHGRTSFPDLRRRMTAERWLTRGVDAITAVSNQLKRDLVKYEGISETHIRVIINGIDLDEGHAITTAHLVLREELGIRPKDSVVGVCCRLVEQKGVAYFLEAASLILKEDKDIVFIVAGDGPLKSNLRDLADRLGITSSVRFLGFRQDVPSILELLSVYVLPSLFEGTPLGLLEAMWAGKAVVATRVGSNEEVIEDGISGSLVDARDVERLAVAIRALCRDQKKAVAMGQRAVERITSSFSLNTMIQQYDGLYQELIHQAM